MDCQTPKVSEPQRVAKRPEGIEWQSGGLSDPEGVRAAASSLERRIFLAEDTHSFRLASKLADLHSGYANRFCACGTEHDPKYEVAAPDNP